MTMNKDQEIFLVLIFYDFANILRQKFLMQLHF